MFDHGSADPNLALRVLRSLDGHEGESAIPSMVRHELQFGCLRLRKSRRSTAIERYLQDVVLASFPILDCDSAAADWHAVRSP